MTNEEKSVLIERLKKIYEPFAIEMSQFAREIADLGASIDMTQFASKDFYNGFMWMRDALLAIPESAEAKAEEAVDAA